MHFTNPLAHVNAGEVASPRGQESASARYMMWIHLLERALQEKPGGSQVANVTRPTLHEVDAKVELRCCLCLSV